MILFTSKIHVTLTLSCSNQCTFSLISHAYKQWDNIELCMIQCTSYFHSASFWLFSTDLNHIYQPHKDQNCMLDPN